MLQRFLAYAVVSLHLLLASCTGNNGGRSGEHVKNTPLNGHLLIIGGSLGDDNKPVYERFIALARQAAAPADKDSPRILIATASSLNQDPAGKTKSILAYCPTCKIDAIMRETPTAETVALIDAASAMFFTGGDQKRVTTRYLSNDQDTPESFAMRRLLARGGVIAGTSAGDAMMSDPMFLTGRSAEALGVRSTRTSAAADEDADDKTPAREIPLGPQIGKGMNFLPWAITDSHFFERHRFGRLVAALEASGKRLGIGVSENACVEVNLATGEAIGLSAADSLLVDVGGLKREGLTRRNIRTTVIQQGTRVSLIARQKEKLKPASPGPIVFDDIPTTEQGRAARGTARRFFLSAQAPTTPGDKPIARRLKLDGYEQLGWSDGRAGAVVEISCPDVPAR